MLECQRVFIFLIEYLNLKEFKLDQDFFEVKQTQCKKQWCDTNSVNPTVNLQDFLALTDNCWQSTTRTVGMEMKHPCVLYLPIV